MPLQKTVVPISLSKGLNTKSDDKQLVVGQLTQLENAVFTVLGRLSKRNGYAALRPNIQGSASIISLGSALATFKNELSLFSGSELFSYSSSSMTWVDKGPATSINLTSNPVVRNTHQQTTCDEAFHPSGVKMFTWEDNRSGTPVGRYSIIDSITGNNLVSDSLIATNAAKPKPFAIGAYLVIVYQDSGTNNLMYVAMSAVTPSVLVAGGPFTISSTFDPSNPVFDAAILNDTLFIAFNNSSGSVTTIYLSRFLVLSAPQIIPGSAASVSVNVAVDVPLNQIWITWYDGTSIRTAINSYVSSPTSVVTVNSATPGVGTVPIGVGFFANQPFTFGGSGTPATGTTIGTVYYVKTVLSSTTFTFSLTSGGTAINTTGPSIGLITFNPQSIVLAPTVVESLSNVKNITSVVSNGLGTIYYDVSAAATYNYFIRFNTLTNIGTAGTPGVFIRSVGLASKAFTYNSVTYFAIAYQSNLQPTYFIVDQNAKIVCKISPSLGGGILVKNQLPEVVTISPGKFALATLIKDLLTTVSGTSTVIFTQTGVQEAILDFISNLTYKTSELANNLHVSGGIMSMYDGTSLVEHGFHLYPENVTATMNGGGGGLSAGQYQYSICYEWTDSQGQIHRSAPSIPTTVTAVSSDSCVLVVPNLRLTAKTGSRADVSIVVYRTQANGTIFYRVSSVTSPILNDIHTDSVSTPTDTLPDSVIIGNPLLYTTGGVLENIAAPAVDALTTYKDRIIYVPSENRLSFGYSKQIVPGSPAEFSDFLVMNVDVRGGKINAIKPMDDNLVIFKETEIFYMAGVGPDATGANNDFQDPILVNTDGGSVGPFVVVTPLGLMYKSQKGIYLIDRSLSVKYVGAGVAAYNSHDIISATLIPNTNQVRFCLDSGIALVYDYYATEWSVFTNHNAVDALIFNSEFTYLKADGTAMIETPGVFTDSGAFIKMRLVTSWLSFAGLNGFQRAYRLMVLGDYISPHQLLVRVAYDFNPNPTQETYINSGALLANPVFGAVSPYGAEAVFGGPYPTYEFDVSFQRQKCTSFQVTIEDIPQTPYGEGMNLSAFSMLIGTKQGLNKLSATRKF